MDGTNTTAPEGRHTPLAGAGLKGEPLLSSTVVCSGGRARTCNKRLQRLGGLVHVVHSRLLSCVFSVCRSAQCCLGPGRKLQIGTWISTSGPPPGRLLQSNREPGAQGTKTDRFGRPPTWFLFHVDRKSSGVRYASSRTIWRCRYVRAFGSHRHIEGTSRIGSGRGVPSPCKGTLRALAASRSVAGGSLGVQGEMEDLRRDAADDCGPEQRRSRQWVIHPLTGCTRSAPPNR